MIETNVNKIIKREKSNHDEFYLLGMDYRQSFKGMKKYMIT